LFEQAISADPDYARPYANLALNTVWQVYSNFAPEEALSRAVALAQEAIARDEGEAWGHWALGAAYLKLGRYDQAVAAYERALALNPNDADVLAESSFLFSWVGRSGEAIENVTAAMRLNPRFEDWYLWGLGVAYYDARKYHEAAKTLASHKSPNLKSNLYLAAAYGQLGRQADAKAVIKAILAENRDSSIELWGKAQPYRNEADLNHYIEGLRKAGLPEQPPLALPDKPSVAVLAFDNLSGDPGQEFLSDGISESIITELSRFSELFVIARHSSFKYKGEAADVRRIGRELGVRYIVEGSMQRAGDGLRVTAQLIDAASGMHVWAESFDRRHADIFAVQDAIIEAIVTALAIKVEEAERLRATRKSTSSLEAYDLFLRARDLQLRKGFWIKEVNREVQEILEQATALDPRFSRAYADLAWTHLYDFIFKWSFPPEAARNRAHALAQKAVEIDPSSARAHYALGYVYLYQKEYELAATEVKRALALNPSDARLRAGSAGLNIYGGDPERAIEQIKEAMRLNPYHEDWYWHFLGWARFHTGAYEEALEAMKRIVNPGAGDHRVMAAINARLGRLEEAARHADEVLKREPDFAISHFRRNLPYRNESDAEDYAGALALAGLPENRPLALPDKPSIAVLALDELSIGDDRGYLADAISEAIITELSRFPELFVIARNSSFKYKGTATDMRDIGRELGVRYVLEGSLQKAGDRLRVTVQLIDALVGNHVWADTYDRNLADIFAVQDEITRTIVSTVASNIEAERIAQIHHSAPASLEAFDYVLRGKSLFVQFSRETHLQAQQMYEQALALDPSYVGGYVGLAWIHINGYRWGWTELPRQQALGRARDFARKALSLDPRDYAAHWVMGNVHMQAGERGQALAEYERALKLNPNAEKVLVDQAELLVYLGRANEALEQIAEAMRLNPYHPEWYYWSLGWAQYYAGAHEEGLATIRRMARMPNLARRSEAALLVRLGRVEEARAVIAALLKNDPDYTVEKARLNVAGKFSDPALMERWLDDLRAAGLPE
jgi:TolB-like protein/Tfp pilus assembly protein PilF